MPASYSNWNSQLTTSTFSVTIASTALSSGSYLVVSWVSASTNTSATISDSAGGSWTTAISFNNTGTATQTWLRTTPGNGGSFSVTVTGTVSGVHAAIGTQYSGATGSISTSTFATGTTSWPSLTTPAATSANDIYYCHAAGVIASTPTFTAGSGWTLGGATQFNSFGGRTQTMQYRAATGATTTTATIITPTEVTLSQTKLSSFVIYGSSSQDFIGWGVAI